MKRHLLLSVIFFVTALVVKGQSTLPPVYEINSDTAVQKIPDRYWQMLVDSNGTWTIDDVTRPPIAEQFHQNTTEKEGLGFSAKYYWQRFSLHNNTGDDVKLVFYSRPRADRFDLFVFRPNVTPEHYVQGSYVRWDERDGLKGAYAVPITIYANEMVTFYKRLFIDHAEPSNSLYIGYDNYDSFLQKHYVDAPWYQGDVRLWFIGGIFIFGFFFNLFFFLIVRDKVYLYMALLLLTEGFWYLLQDWSVALRNELAFKSIFMFLVTHLLFFFSVMQFVRYFLKIPKYYPKWDKALFGLFILMAGSALISFDGSPVHIQFPFSFGWWPILIAETFFFLLMMALFTSFIFLRKEKDWLNKLAIIAATPAFILWSVGYFIRALAIFYQRAYDAKIPSALDWYINNEVIIEMFCLGSFAILFTWILLQRYAQLRKQYALQALEREREKAELMNRQKEELESQVAQRTAELKNSLEELKNTQVQLIQSEKMASLGELTAGIAHEIQNPLNFINNFSEVSSELADELEKEIKDGNTEETFQITSDLKQNLEKIVHHGKRADSIVKNMLQHSRQSTGEKLPVAINTLVDECLRLSYHGLRAKDKSFNASMETNFDDSVGKVNVVSQDIGRVLLNLFNNSFYSVMQKKKQLGNGYDPTISVSTKKTNDKVVIHIHDNGLGIPKAVIDKIYQPFFTTKPSGEGTGLGLSMSYDIITKGHGGTLSAKTVEGEFATFNIVLPV